MMVNTNNLVSLTEANRNFSKVARMVDERGSAVILKNNAPRYLVIDFSKVEAAQEADDEERSERVECSCAVSRSGEDESRNQQE